MDRTFPVCSLPSAFSASEGHVSPTHLAGLVQRVSWIREWYRFPSEQLSLGGGMYLGGNEHAEFPGSVPQRETNWSQMNKTDVSLKSLAP